MLHQPIQQSGYIGALVNRTLQKYFGSFDSFFKLTFVFELPYSLISVWYTQQLQSIKSISETLSQAQSLHLIQTGLFMFGVSILYFLILSPLFTGAITHLVAQTEDQQTRSWTHSVHHAWKRFGPLFATGLLAGVFIIVAAVLVSILLVVFQVSLGADSITGGMVRFLLVILMVCLSVIFYIRLCLLYNVTTLEEKMGWTAMVGSWRMTRGLFWRLLAILLLMWLINASVTLLIPIVLKSVFSFGPVFDNTVLALVLLLTAPLTPIALSIVYLDIRKSNHPQYLNAN